MKVHISSGSMVKKAVRMSAMDRCKMKKYILDILVLLGFPVHNQCIVVFTELFMPTNGLLGGCVHVPGESIIWSLGRASLIPNIFLTFASEPFANMTF